MSENGRDPLIIGRIGAPYGIRGWVRLHSFTEPMDNILGYQQLSLRHRDGWQAVVIDSGHRHGKGLVAHIEGIDDRDQAEALKGSEIGVPADVLPALEEDEYYWHQLEGLSVYGEQTAARNGTPPARNRCQRRHGCAALCRQPRRTGTIDPLAGACGGNRGGPGRTPYRRGLGPGVLSRETGGSQPVPGNVCRVDGTRRDLAGGSTRAVLTAAVQPAGPHHRPSSHRGRPALWRRPRHADEDRTAGGGDRRGAPGSGWRKQGDLPLPAG